MTFFTISPTSPLWFWPKKLIYYMLICGIIIASTYYTAATLYNKEILEQKEKLLTETTHIAEELKRTLNQKNHLVNLLSKLSSIQTKLQLKLNHKNEKNNKNAEEMLAIWLNTTFSALLEDNALITDFRYILANQNPRVLSHVSVQNGKILTYSKKQLAQETNSAFVSALAETSYQPLYLPPSSIETQSDSFNETVKSITLVSKKIATPFAESHGLITTKIDTKRLIRFLSNNKHENINIIAFTKKTQSSDYSPNENDLSTKPYQPTPLNSAFKRKNHGHALKNKNLILNQHMTIIPNKNFPQNRITLIMTKPIKTMIQYTLQNFSYIITHIILILFILCSIIIALSRLTKRMRNHSKDYTIGKTESLNLDIRPNPTVDTINSTHDVDLLNNDIIIDQIIPSTSPLKGIDILLAEDNAINQEICKSLLEESGATITVVENGLDAIEIIKQKSNYFNIILMDIHMPLMNGYDATQMIREDLGLIDIPILAITANTKEEGQQKAFQSGMNGYITKPFNIEELIKTIHEHIISNHKEIDKSHIPDITHLEFDPSNAIKRMKNNKNIYIKTLNNFLEFSRELVRSLPRNLPNESTNPEKFEDVSQIIGNHIHNLKGLSSTVGANTISTTCSEIETFNKNGNNHHQYSELRQQLENQINYFIEIANNWLTNHKNHTSLSKNAHKQSTKRYHLLVIDDEPIITTLVESILESKYEISIAHSTIESAEKITENEPDLILLDVNLNGESGFDICQKINKELTTNAPPIIFMTGDNTEETESKCWDVGGSDFVLKPLNAKTLEKRIQSHLKLSEKNKSYKDLAFNDALTGISNRRLFNDRLNLEWRHCHRSNESLSVIMIDVDFFKNYNDLYGHQEGDHCLLRIAKVIQTYARRPRDVCARYGGEEFIIMLPGAKIEDSISISNKIEASIRKIKIPHTQSPYQIVTVSIGVSACVPNNLSSPEELIKEADENLYYSKDQGRAKVSSS